MFYTDEQIGHFTDEFHNITGKLQKLNLRGVAEAQSIESPRAREYLTHGVGRRLGILQKSIEEIFQIFPLDQEEVLNRGQVTTVQIYLHAFVINLYGVFDNWAWSFVHRHELIDEIGNVRHVGLFRNRTQGFLPRNLREYLQADDIVGWYQDYLKWYRDALAHRIPLYVPPASWTDEDTEVYERLEEEKARLFREANWARLDEVWDEQDRIGRPSFIFLHEISEDGDTRPVLLHPQILTDGLTVVDFGNKFYDEWHHCE